MKLTNKHWWKAAAVRAIKTFAQTVIAMVPVAVSIIEIDWSTVLGVGVCAALLSLLTSLAGLPEVEDDGDE